jgi:serine/threonine protein kinase
MLTIFTRFKLEFAFTKLRRSDSQMDAEPIPVLPAGTCIRNLMIDQLLGSGAFSNVYRCRRATDPDFVALKVCPKSGMKNDTDRVHLQMELDAMAFLHHPNVVSLRDFFFDDENYYLVLDYCEGGDLANYLVTQQQLREPMVAAVFHQIVSGIEHCHSRGVAHRDLKPQNVLITTFPTVRVTDFGLASHFYDRKLHTFCGSVCYAAPECLSMVEYDGELADLWSLGVILYELMAGHAPWNMTSIPKMIAQIKAGQYTIPPAMNSSCADLIRRMMKVKPTERIKCEKILAHPWLHMAPSHALRQRSALPKLQSPKGSLLTLVQSFDRPGDSIVSPFEHNVKSDVPGGMPVVKLTSEGPGAVRKSFLALPVVRQAMTPRRGPQFTTDREKGAGRRRPRVSTMG